MGHKVSYDSTSMHSQNYLEMLNFIREYGDGDVPGTSNPQTPGVNQQRSQRVRVPRGCETCGMYGNLGRHY